MVVLKRVVIIMLVLAMAAANVYAFDCITVLTSNLEDSQKIVHAQQQQINQLTQIVGDIAHIQEKEHETILQNTHPETIVRRMREWLTRSGEFDATRPQEVSRGSVSRFQPGESPRYRTSAASISAYTASADENGGNTSGKTASGVQAEIGHLAMDGVPFGTPVLIDGVGLGIVADRFGGGFGDGKVDILMTSKSAAYKFGRQSRQIYILQ